LPTESADSTGPGNSEAPGKTARELAHDLSNALEIIIQTSFLIGTLELGENGKSWHGMLDDGVRKAVAINRQLREAIRDESARSRPGS
jgi:hypothetical protein